MVALPAPDATGTVNMSATREKLRWLIRQLDWPAMVVWATLFCRAVGIDQGFGWLGWRKFL